VTDGPGGVSVQGRSDRRPVRPRSCTYSPEAHLVGAIREELGRLFSFGERHRRLSARLALVIAATLAIDVVGSVAIYFLERHAQGTDVRSFGQAFFFTTVQLLTVSSQIKNPITPTGRVVDVGLELWAVIVVAGSAGAIAAFFQNGDSQ
jgi:hypothetical protein